MKVLVVLVLAVLSGCNAHPSAARPRPKLDVMAESVLDIVLVHAKAASRILREFGRTEFGNAVQTFLRKASNDAGKFVGATSKALFPITTAVLEATLKAGFRLGERVSGYIVRNHLEPMVERAAPLMEEALGELVLRSELVQDVVSPYITELMETVDPILQDIQARIHALNKSSVNTE